MPFPDPPADNGAFHWVMYLVTVVLVVVVVTAVKFLADGHKTGGGAEPPSIEIETRGADSKRVSLEGMAPNVAEALAANSVMVNSIFRENQQHESRIAALEAEKQTLSEDQVHLISEIVMLRKGVADGSIPPLPELTAKLHHLLGEIAT